MILLCERFICFNGEPGLVWFSKFPISSQWIDSPCFHIGVLSSHHPSESRQYGFKLIWWVIGGPTWLNTAFYEQRETFQNRLKIIKTLIWRAWERWCWQTVLIQGCTVITPLWSPLRAQGYLKDKPARISSSDWRIIVHYKSMLRDRCPWRVSTGNSLLQECEYLNDVCAMSNSHRGTGAQYWVLVTFLQDLYCFFFSYNFQNPRTVHKPLLSKTFKEIRKIDLFKMHLNTTLTIVLFFLTSSFRLTTQKILHP